MDNILPVGDERVTTELLAIGFLSGFGAIAFMFGTLMNILGAFAGMQLTHLETTLPLFVLITLSYVAYAYYAILCSIRTICRKRMNNSG